jgi:tRNA(adenine34) deaminase
MKEKYMLEAIHQAKRAYKQNDVPVGCIIVKNNKVIAKGYNKKELKKNAIKHAEIIAIDKACKKLKTWHLEQCELYTTMEPCLMCSGAIIQSRIGCIYYAIENNKFGENNIIKKYNKKIKIEKIYNENYETMLKKFFEEKRK